MNLMKGDSTPTPSDENDDTSDGRQTNNLWAKRMSFIHRYQRVLTVQMQDEGSIGGDGDTNDV